MKIGDRIYSTKVRSGEVAEIVKVDVDIKERIGKKPEIRTKYLAKYLDGSEITFYGFNINKSVFKKMDADGQYTIFDYI